MNVLAPLLVVLSTLALAAWIVRQRPRSERAPATSGASLATLREGDTAEIGSFDAACRGRDRNRLMDLGLLPGTRVTCERRGMSGGLASYRVRGTAIALRQAQARLIALRAAGKDAS